MQLIEQEIVAWVEMQAEAKELRRQASSILAGNEANALEMAERAASVQVEADRLRDLIISQLGK